MKLKLGTKGAIKTRIRKTKNGKILAKGSSKRHNLYCKSKKSLKAKGKMRVLKASAAVLLKGMVEQI
jgi:ribosomal protein L35